MKLAVLVFSAVFVLIGNCYAEELIPEYVEATVKETIPAVESSDEFQELAVLFKIDPSRMIKTICRLPATTF